MFMFKDFIFMCFYAMCKQELQARGGVGQPGFGVNSGGKYQCGCCKPNGASAGAAYILPAEAMSAVPGMQLAWDSLQTSSWLKNKQRTPCSLSPKSWC